MSLVRQPDPHSPYCFWGQVGRGQKLGEPNGSLEFADMTVEDLLHIIRNLPPEESAVSAVSRGLYYLDSRALAALLKELHKAGLSNRCAPAAAGRVELRHMQYRPSSVLCMCRLGHMGCCKLSVSQP